MTVLMGKYSSVPSSARSVAESKTGVVCVWNPVIFLGLPACPTVSTAKPTRAMTGTHVRDSSTVINMRGFIAHVK